MWKRSKKFRPGRKTLLLSGFIALFFLAGGATLLLNMETGAIRLYRKFASPRIGAVATCRYETSCSAYGLKVLLDDGFWMGNLKLGKRLFCCSPMGWAYEKASGENLYPHRQLPEPGAGLEGN